MPADYLVFAGVEALAFPDVCALGLDDLVLLAVFECFLVLEVLLAAVLDGVLVAGAGVAGVVCAKTSAVAAKRDRRSLFIVPS
jgi:hypothetical protein